MKDATVTLRACSYHTPVGALAVLVNDRAVVAAGFCRPQELADRLPDRPGWIECERLEPFQADIEAYLAGDVDALGRIPVNQPGTELQKRVWSQLREIPAGQTTSYGELAQAIDHPRAARAVGSACGRNLVAPFVPCHRVLRRDGSLGGYAYGLAVKQWLLNHERRSLAA